MATYYVKLNGGTGTGLDDANAWSYTKYNSTPIASGDTILFKKDEKYRGSLVMMSGSSGNVVTYSSYGTGNNPIISGFVQPTSWTLHNGNIYYTTLTIDFLSIIKVDGIVKGMGRYPKVEYLPYTYHYQNSHIGGDSVLTLPSNFNGAEVVVKKYRYVIDRHPGITITGSDIEYIAGYNYEYYGYNGTYEGTDGNGYFIQNHINCLTEDGEWSYDHITKRLYVYFDSGPSGRIVNAVEKNKVLDLSNKTYINISNIDFEGGDYGLYTTGTSYLSVANCKFYNHGIASIYGLYSHHITVDGVEIKDNNNNGIQCEYDCPNWTIINSVIDNIGQIAGMSKSGDGAAMGIVNGGLGNNLVVRNNKISNIGYCGVSFDGNDAVIEKNFVNFTCTVKDDGAGIYTYTGLRPIIQKNIVLNSMGNLDGTGWDIGQPFTKGAGIYLDNGVTAHNATVVDNFVANGGYAGIFINNTGQETIQNNIVYNCKWQLFITDYSPSTLRGFNVTNNTFIAKTIEQQCVFIELGVPDDIGELGLINNNVYARPTDDNKTMTLRKHYQNAEVKYALGAWRTKFGLDVNSTGTLVTVNNENKFAIHYNETAFPVTIQLNGIWHDVQGNTYTGSLQMPAYSGTVLLKYIPLGMIKNGKLLTKGGKILLKKQIFI